MANELKKQYPSLQGFVWNFSISGHGKGAADGMGAVLKRTVDSAVAHGKDIGNKNDLYHCVSSLNMQFFFFLYDLTIHVYI